MFPDVLTTIHWPLSTSLKRTGRLRWWSSCQRSRTNGSTSNRFEHFLQVYERMAVNHHTVGRSLLPNSIERDRDALVTLRQLERRSIKHLTKCRSLYRRFCLGFTKSPVKSTLRSSLDTMSTVKFMENWSEKRICSIRVFSLKVNRRSIDRSGWTAQFPSFV